MHLPAESEAREAFEQIEAAAITAAELTSQMLAYSGQGRLVVGPIALKQIVEEMTQLLRAILSKSVEVRYEHAADVPPIQGDATQLRQIVMNLMINASEAIGDADGVITLRTGVAGDRRPRSAAAGSRDGSMPGRTSFLEVSDTGSGMDDATAGRIFDPFFTTKFTGRGLGLAAAQGIMRSHHGAITVETRRSAGARRSRSSSRHTRPRPPATRRPIARAAARRAGPVLTRAWHMIAAMTGSSPAVSSRAIAVSTHGRYLVAAPTAAGPWPMLVGFHGYAENAEIQLDRLRAIPGSERWLLVSRPGAAPFLSQRFERRRRRRVDDAAGSRAGDRGQRRLRPRGRRRTPRASGPRTARSCTPASRRARRWPTGRRPARRASAVIALGGDVPPELDQATLAAIPAALVGRGARDGWYTTGTWRRDLERLEAAGVRARPFEFDAGHEWTDAFGAAAATFLGERR